MKKTLSVVRARFGLVLALSLAAVALLLVGGIVAASADTRIMTDPTAAHPELGSVFTVTIKIQNAVELNGVDFTLRFDPSQLEVVNPSTNQLANVIVGGGTLWQGHEMVADMPGVTNSADNTNGVIHYAAAMKNTGGEIYPSVTGSGSIARIPFRVKRTGSSHLDFDPSLTIMTTGATLTPRPLPGTNGLVGVWTQFINLPRVLGR